MVVGSGHLQNHLEQRVSKGCHSARVREVKPNLSSFAWTSSSFQTFLSFERCLVHPILNTRKLRDTDTITPSRFITKFSASGSPPHRTDCRIYSTFKTHWLVPFVPAFNYMY